MATAIKKFEGTIGSAGGTTNAFDGGLISDSVYEDIFANLSGMQNFIASSNMNNDGTRIYILEVTDSDQVANGDDAWIGYFELDTAYDVTTLQGYTRVAQTSDFPSFPGNASGFDFTPDGTKFVICNAVNFYYYSLSTAYDFTTATLQAERLWATGTGSTDICAGATRVKVKLTATNSSTTGVAILSASSSTNKFTQKYFNTNASGGSFSTWANVGDNDSFLDIINGQNAAERYFGDFAVGDFDGYSTFGATTFFFMGTPTDNIMDNLVRVFCPNGNVGSPTTLNSVTFTGYTSQSYSYTQYPICGMFAAQNNLYVLDLRSNVYKCSFTVFSDSGADVSVSYDTDFTDNTAQGSSDQRVCFKFNNDGTKFFNANASSIRYYDLSTPYDLTTRGSAQTCSFNVSLGAFCFNADGTTFYAVPYSPSSGTVLYKWSLDTAFTLPSSLNTSSAVANKNLYSLNNTFIKYLNNLDISEDEKVFWAHPSQASSQENRVIKLYTPTAGDIVNLTYSQLIDFGPDLIGCSVLTERGVIIGIDVSHGLTRKIVSNLNSNVSSNILFVAQTLTAASVRADYMNGSANSGFGVHYDPNGEVFVLSADSTSNDNLYFSTVSSGEIGFNPIPDEDITTYNFAPYKRYDAPRGINFANSGSTLIISPGSAPTYALQAYSLTTPYDISTASVDSGNILLVGSSGTYNRGSFNDDGTKFYVGVTSTLRQYTLSTAYDLSSASSSFDTLALPANNSSLTFNSAGTKFYTVSGTSIYQYNMSTAYDITTASSAGSVDENSYNGGNTLGTIQDCVLSSDSSRMFLVTSNDAAYTLYMPQPGEISSLQHSGDFFGLSGQSADPVSLAFNNDGTKFYALDSTSDNFYQYTSTSNVGTDVTVYTCPPATAAKIKVSMQGEFGQLKLDDNTVIEIPSKSGVYHTLDAHRAASSGTVIFSPAGGNASFLDQFNDYFQLEAGETIKVTDARSMDYSIQVIEDSDGS